MPETTEKLSFFRLPLLFITAVIGLKVFSDVVLMPLISDGDVRHYPALMSVMDTMIEMLTYIPVLFIVPAFVFWRNHFCRMDARSVVAVIKMALCCFLLLRLAAEIQLYTEGMLAGRAALHAVPPVLRIVLLWYLKVLIAVSIIWLIAWRMTRPYYPQAPQFRLTPENHRFTGSALLAILVTLFYFPLLFQIATIPGDQRISGLILRQLMDAFTTDYINELVDVLLMAVILMTMSYTAFGYGGEKLPFRRLMLTGLCGTLLYIAVYFGLMNILFFIIDSRDYVSPAAIDNGLIVVSYLNMVMAALILRVVVKRVFRAAPAAVAVTTD